MITYAHLPEGMLTTVSTVFLHVVPVGPPGHGLDLNSNPDAGLVYDNYCKDYKSRQYYGCSYEDYMISIVDNLIVCAENSILTSDHPALGVGVIPLSNDQYHEQTNSDACITGIAHTEHDLQLVQQLSLGQSYESSTTDRVRIEISIIQTNLQVTWLKKVLSSNSLVLTGNLWLFLKLNSLWLLLILLEVPIYLTIKQPGYPLNLA